MSRMRWISAAVGLCVVGVLINGWQGSWGQTAKKAAAIAPEHCFSAKTVAYLRIDGTKAHQADWEKTAAYKGLVKSGLTAALDKWLAAASAEEPRVEIGRKLLWQIFEKGVSIGVALPDDPQSPNFGLTVVLHQGAALEKGLFELLPPDVQSVQQEFARNGAKKVRTIAFLPNVENWAISWWTEGPHLVLTAGGDADEVLKVLDGTTPNITTQPDWKRRNALDDGQVLTGVSWIDFRGLIEKYRDIEVPVGPGNESMTVGTLLSLLGLDNLTEVVGRQGYDGKACVSRVDFLHDGPRRGVLKLLEGKPMTLDSLPPLPEYNSTIVSGSLDFAAIYDAVISVAQAVMEKGNASENDRDQFQQALDQADEAVGGSLRDDLLANLGPVHVFFNDPANGIAGFGAGYAAQIKNPGTLRGVMDWLLQQVPEPRNPNEARLTRTKEDGREFISFGQPGIPISANVTITDDWIIAGTSHAVLQSFLQRQQGTAEKWKASEEQQEQLDKLPKEFVSFSLNDPREWIKTIDQYLPAVQAAMASSPQKLPRLELPSGERIAKPMFPSAYVTTMDDDGIHYHGRQALPGIPLVGTLDNMSVATTAVAIALLLPAVQQAREAARRTQSRNNLKQLGLALHNYHDTYNQFPPGIVAGQDKPEDSISWYAPLLPYMDQAELAKKLDQKKKWNDEANKTIGQTAIQAFRNPSATDVKADGYAQADYAGVAGLGKDGPKKKVSDKGAGFFAYGRATRIRDITDGTSNTVTVGEIVKDRGPWLQGGTGTIRPLVEKPYIGGPDGWGGNHTGGSMFLMGDGSVRFISQNVDPKTMEALVTIQGGETIGDF